MPERILRASVGDAGSGKEHFKKMFFAGRKKSVERESVFADMRVNEKCDFGVELAEGRVRGKRNGDDVADTTDIHKDLIGSFVSEPAAKLSNHRTPVLPLFLRPSTRDRDRG